MAFLFSAAYLSKRYNQKILFGIIYTLPSIIGTIVFLSTSYRYSHRYAKTDGTHSGANQE